MISVCLVGLVIHLYSCMPPDAGAMCLAMYCQHFHGNITWRVANYITYNK